MQKKQSLSVVINTKNEEKMIAGCIKSVSHIADEIIVADMNSTDNTVKIAKKLKAQSFSVPDYGFVEPARNLALSKVTKDWVLVLDADERITPNLGKLIKKLISEDKYDVIGFPRKNIILGKWLKHGLRWPDFQNRLFKKGFVNWSDNIHEEARYKGRKYQLQALEKNALVHYNYDSVESLMERTYRYASKEKYYEKKNHLTANDIYHRMEDDFRWRFFEHQGYKDGVHGLIINKFMEVYRFLEFALFWEKNGQPELITANKLKNLWDIEMRLNDTKRELNKTKDELNRIKDSKIYIFYKLYLAFKKLIIK